MVGKKDTARRIIEDVRLIENIPPDSLTPLAILGQPAKSSTESRMREKTCEVEGSRDANTMEADNAEVSDSEDDRLLSVPQNHTSMSVRIISIRPV